MTLFTVGTPENRSNAFLFDAGKAKRMYTPLTGFMERGLFDVYLELEPAKPVFEWTQTAHPPVNTNSGIRLRLEPGAPEPASYTLDVRTMDGQPVKHWAGLKATPAGKGVLTLQAPWVDPHLWSPEDPYCYRYQVTALDAAGRVIDQTLPKRFGSGRCGSTASS